jgi:hypothetical protein
MPRWTATPGRPMTQPRQTRSPIGVLALLLGCGMAQAVNGADLDLRVTDADLEPRVTLSERVAATVQEYRINNRLYQIKITPRVGAPYYLVDEDGSGDMAWHRGGSQFENNIPQWALLSW